ncbi:MAG: DHH family phosphoesterase [Coriobacteriia bacterium]|nr:DHH family phosphoesterase [Coriobacteriia bacterium]
MAVTPQTNTTLEEIAAVLREADNVVIAGHVSPDGDCIGSQLALMWALRGLGKNVAVTLARDEAIDGTLAFLPGVECLQFAGAFTGPVDTFVAVDVPTKERLLEAQWALHEQAATTITVDHHAVPTAMARYSYTDPDAASTTLMMWQIACMLGQTSAEVAQCAYTGLMTDTGGFRYSNSDETAFAAAADMVACGADPALSATKVYQQRTRASVELEGLVTQRMAFSCNGQFVISYVTLEDFQRLGATKADAEPMVDLLRSLAGVRVACMLREQETDVRGSLRSKDDTDISVVARHFGGGGHKAAAGFSLERPLDRALDRVTEQVMKVLGARG